ncbi:MAG: alpha/beta hydrolase [Candidatus Ornithospirochaeta sp.]
MRKDLPYSFSLPSSWNEGCYSDKSSTVKASRPFSIIHPEESDRAVLLIHGFTGYPGELTRPAEDLYERGFDVFVPRLPGHGTSGKDFIKTTHEDWLRAADNAVMDLISRYKSVSVVGHSMGGAIAAVLMERHKEIKSGVLCCPGIEISFLDDKTVKALSFISHFVKRMKKEWHSDDRYHLHYEDAPGDDMALGKEYWSWTYTRQVLSLKAIGDEAGANLNKIKSPVLIIGGGKDELIAVSSLPAIVEKIGDNASLRTIRDGVHYIYYDITPEAEEEAVEATVSFLSL